MTTFQIIWLFDSGTALIFPKIQEMVAALKKCIDTGKAEAINPSYTGVLFGMDD